MRDPYDTGRSVALNGRLHEERRRRDATIERLGEQLAPPWRAGGGAVRPDVWEVERERLWREFDYGEADRALERLRDVDAQAYHAVMGVHVYGWLPGSSWSERGLELLDRWLPDPLRAPGVVVPRDELIRRRVREGVPSRVLAGEFGLSVRRINEIVAAGEGPA